MVRDCRHGRVYLVRRFANRAPRNLRSDMSSPCDSRKVREAQSQIRRDSQSPADRIRQSESGSCSYPSRSLSLAAHCAGSTRFPKADKSLLRSRVQVPRASSLWACHSGAHVRMVCLQPSAAVNEESRDLGCVISQDELILRRVEWKRNAKRVVFASGAFDLLHPGHVRLIEQARSYGDVLVVGIESEVSSHDRRDPQPGLFGLSITPAAERAEIVAAMAAVDFAVEFDPNSSPPYAGRLP